MRRKHGRKITRHVTNPLSQNSHHLWRRDVADAERAWVAVGLLRQECPVAGQIYAHGCRGYGVEKDGGTQRKKFGEGFLTKFVVLSTPEEENGEHSAHWRVDDQGTEVEFVGDVASGAEGSDSFGVLVQCGAEVGAVKDNGTGEDLEVECCQCGERDWLVWKLGRI